MDRSTLRKALLTTATIAVTMLASSSLFAYSHSDKYKSEVKKQNARVTGTIDRKKNCSRCRKCHHNAACKRGYHKTKKHTHW